MRLKLHFIILFIFANLGLGLSQVAYDQYFVRTNEPYTFALESYCLPSITKTTTKGISTINYNPTRITYTANPNFTGKDTLIVSYCPTPSTPFGVYKFVVFNVYDEWINAKKDFSSTNINTPIEINVASNDTSTNSVKIITNISLTNNCSATILNNSTLSITPKQDFEGVAYVNYTICNGTSNCSNSIVSLVVTDNSIESSLDTITEVINQGTSTWIPLEHNGYELFTASNFQGTNTIASNFLNITPNQSYTGNAEIKLYATENSVVRYKTIYLQVVPKVANNFILDDIAYTTTNKAVNIAVRDNDLFKLSTISQFTQPNGGTVTLNQDGKTFTYTPLAGFTGADVFTYKVCNFASACETGKVNITVSNYSPVLAVYDFERPKNTPLVINYGIPISEFYFVVLSQQSNYGNVQFHQGNQTLNINGQNIAGQNMIIYTPNNNFVGADQFEIQYCLTNEPNNCKLIKVNINIADLSSQDPFCIQNCVWSGDTNLDGTVDVRDIIPLGLYMGEAGNTRLVTGNAWYGKFADNWNIAQSRTPQNLKYVDSNGDGLVSIQDTNAIAMNYAKYHQLTSPVDINFKNYPFSIELPEGSPESYSIGDILELDLLIGTSNQIASDIYGMYLPLNAPETVSFVEASYDENSWLSNYAPVLTMTKKMDNRVDIGYTLCDGVPQTGYGKVGRVKFVIEDDASGFRYNKQLYIAPEFVQLFDGSGTGFNVPFTGVSINLSSEEKDFKDSDVLVYPNPSKSNSAVNIHLNGINEFKNISLYTVTGQLVQSVDIEAAKHTTISTSQLNNGVYFIEVITANGTTTKKLEVLND